MRTPNSFALAYVPHRALGDKLEELAGPRLQTLCRTHGWLFADRVKDEESALAKLQMSPVQSLSTLHDVYASTIVVPTTAQVQDAVAVVEAAFPGAEVVPRRRPRADTFRYNDTHVYANLGAHAAGLADAIRDRKFEIQIKSGLQYAWWRATHDVLYKGAERSWQVSRVAGQIRAALELMDTQLGNLRRSAEVQGPLPADDADEDFAEVAGWLSRWDEDRRPENISGFVRSVQDIRKAASLSAAAIAALLDGDEGQKLIANPDVTPFQAVLTAVVLDKGAAVIDRVQPDIFVLVTEEMLAAAPTIADITEARLARLD